ncbi:MAG: SWIM zinc finger family protein [Cyanobacteria bacterium P01_A01_bin.84]
MSANWTPEQILSLAPDASSAKNGRTLATASKWNNLGYNKQAVWGECKGSGKNPYKTQIDLREPAFKCSCPSRKFPCKHGLGLFLLLSSELSTSENSTFVKIQPPEWVTQWLDSRTQRKAKKAESKAENIQKETHTTDRAKRAQKRLEKVNGGIQDLEVWLRDLMRQGLATVQGKPLSFWDNVAARLVDAQAPGIAKIIKAMGSIPYSGVGWQERLLAQLGKVYLLIEGFKRIETLPVDIQADIRTQIGWNQTKEELGSKSGIKDTWLIVGQQVESEDRLKVQRNWLWGKDCQQAALILNFAHHSQPLDISLIPGSCIDAELVFFESAYPLRAIVKNREEISTSVNEIPGYKSIQKMLQTYASSLAQNPWIETFPVGLHHIIPIQIDNLWLIQDIENHQLPIKLKFAKCWNLLALSSGHPIDIFGEWDGEYFLPLSIFVNNTFIVI